MDPRHSRRIAPTATAYPLAKGAQRFRCANMLDTVHAADVHSKLKRPRGNHRRRYAITKILLEPLPFLLPHAAVMDKEAIDCSARSRAGLQVGTEHFCGAL